MKKIYIFINIIFISVWCIAQKDYSQYYKEKYNYSDITNLQDYQNSFITRIRKAFKKNKPLPYDLLLLSNYYYQSGQTNLGKRFLFKAAASGLSIEDARNRECIDSLFEKNAKIKIKYLNKYRKTLQKCDIEHSIKIVMMFEKEQNYRNLYTNNIDSNFNNILWKEVEKVDSVNYFSMLEIMKEPNFDSRKLTNDAKLNFAVILMHNATNSFANPDTIFSLLKCEVLKGVICPEFYANSVDRYYMFKGYNYYCNFYDDKLPIYEISKIDIRRSEIWLYPLYYKFKWNDKLDKLPNDYKYDTNSIRY